METLLGRRAGSCEVFAKVEEHVDFVACSARPAAASGTQCTWPSSFEPLKIVEEGG